MLSGTNRRKQPTREVLAQFRRKLPTPDAAAYLGLGKSTVDKMRVTGGGPAYCQFGKRVVYDPTDLDAWAVKHKRSSTSETTAAA